jgi:hypothetical protein
LLIGVPTIKKSSHSADKIYMDVSSIALNGLATAERAVQRTASRLATAGDPAAMVDIAGEMVNLMRARNDFSANIKVLENGQEMQKYLIDIFA